MMERLNGLDGHTAVVTGGSKGIGAAIARALAEAGADCVLAARGEADLDETATSIEAASGRRIVPVAGDLRDPDTCDRLHATVLDQFGGIDILVNCAGATRPGPFADMTDDDWLDGFALKFHATVRLCRLFWPQLVESHGTVVNVIGGLARTPSPDVMIAGAVNAAFANFSKALAGLGLRDDVNVNAIHPGQTRTERHKTMMQARAAAAGISAEDFEQRIVDRQGLRRLGEPEDVAALAVFLCRPEARHIQGTSISVDGGGTAGLF